MFTTLRMLAMAAVLLGCQANDDERYVANPREIALTPAKEPHSQLFPPGDSIRVEGDLSFTGENNLFRLSEGKDTLTVTFVSMQQVHSSIVGPSNPYFTAGKTADGATLIEGVQTLWYGDLILRNDVLYDMTVKARILAPGGFKPGRYHFVAHFRIAGQISPSSSLYRLDFEIR